MADFYIAVNMADICRVFHCLLFLLNIQEFKHSLRCRCRGLQHICHLGDLLDRLCEVSDILEKRLHITYFDLALDHHESAQQSNHHISQVTHKLHDRHHHTGEKLRAPCRAVQLFIGLLKFADHGLFLVKCLYNIMSAINLLHLSVYFTQILLLCLEIFL